MNDLKLTFFISYTNLLYVRFEWEIKIKHYNQMGWMKPKQNELGFSYSFVKKLKLINNIFCGKSPTVYTYLFIQFIGYLEAWLKMWWMMLSFVIKYPLFIWYGLCVHIVEVITQWFTCVLSIFYHEFIVLWWDYV